MVLLPVGGDEVPHTVRPEPVEGQGPSAVLIGPVKPALKRESRLVAAP